MMDNDSISLVQRRSHARGKTSGALARVLCVLVAAAFIQSCGKDVPPQPAHAIFKFEAAKTLPPEERAVENRFANAIEDNLNVFIAAYRWKWPKVVNTDNARELSEDYAPDGFELMTEQNKEHRTKYTLATQGPSRALAMEVYKQMLKEKPTGSEQPLVVFTAGGAGSGKSTSVAAVAELQEIMDQAQIVFDTTLSSPDSLSQVKMALDAGKSVKIFYIYRNPEQAFVGMLGRAARTGRPVTISNFISTHLGAPTVLDGVAKRFEDEIRRGAIEIKVIDNTGGPGSAKIAQGGPNFIDENAKQYSQDQLRKQLLILLNDALERGEISKTLYEAIDK